MRWQDLIFNSVLREGPDVSGNISSDPTETNLPSPPQGEEGTGGETTPPQVSSDTSTTTDTATAVTPPTKPAKRPWFEQRIDTLTARHSALEQQLAMEKQLREAAEARIAAATGATNTDVTPKPPGPTQYTEQEVQARAQAIAAAESFTRECNKVVEKGRAAYSDFMASVDRLNKDLGGMPQHFVEAAFETGIPEKVIYNLGKDPEKATEILAMPPAKQAVALTKYAMELEKSPIKISNAPPPITPKVGGNGRADPSLDDPELDINEWMRLRNKQLGVR